MEEDVLSVKICKIDMLFSPCKFNVTSKMHRQVQIGQ